MFLSRTTAAFILPILASAKTNIGMSFFIAIPFLQKAEIDRFSVLSMAKIAMKFQYLNDVFWL
jgi:hypothetical protein